MMPPDRKLIRFSGRLVMVGFGSIGQGVLPLILRHIEMPKDRIIIMTADARGEAEAAAQGIQLTLAPLTRDNYATLLTPILERGDFLLNLSVDVSSAALMEFCQKAGALYLDTCIEPWPGRYTDQSLSLSERSNYALREEILALRRRYKSGPTALPTHGANPGLVSHLVKKALLNLAADSNGPAGKPGSRTEWAELAAHMRVKAIHIAERDTQTSSIPKRVGEFINTWSVDGFYSESLQPAELGWGSHEKDLPVDGHRHAFGSGAAIYLARPGAATRIRSWTPLEGPYHGFLITHSEAISIADYLTLRERDELRYRPTVHYTYHPCDAAILSTHELAGKNWQLQKDKRIMMDDIVSGIDELGVLLMGHARNSYWFGSQLSITEARSLAPFNNATSLQVTATVLAGMIWAMENPNLSILEPDEVDFERILEIATPYLGKLTGAYSDWTPLLDREELFTEDVDRDDPWQFRNFRVV
jgi:homospermidine synthase